MRYPEAIEQLIEILTKLPGVGKRTAERFAFDMLLNWSEPQLAEISKRIQNISVCVDMCADCGSLTDRDQCPFCSDHLRIRNVLCIVSSPKEVFAIENTREFRGLYHVLKGLLSPLDGKGEDVLELEKLHMRIVKEEIQEVILALDSTLEGDATSLFIKQELQKFSIKVSRLAFGIPVGSPLEYVDGGTLARAFMGRATY